MSMKKDVVCAFTNNTSCTHELKKCWLETLPALLCHITLRGADNMASCKLLGKLLHLHTQQHFISDLFFLFMQTNEDRASLWSTGCQPVIDTGDSLRVQVNFLELRLWVAVYTTELPNFIFVVWKSNVWLTVHRNSVWIINQLDVTFCVILYFSFTSCSTCFGQPCAHHQELTTA